MPVTAVFTYLDYIFRRSSLDLECRARHKKGSLVPEEWIAEQERMSLLPYFLEATLSSLRDQLNLFGQRQVLLDSLGQLQMPTLVVWGTEDLIFPKEQAQDAVSRLQKGQLALIPDCGHIPHIERPEQFTEALSQFLAGVDF